MDKRPPDQSGASESVSDIFQQAIHYHQNGDILKAEELYKKVLELDIAHADSYHLTGIIAYEKKEYHHAESLIDKAISLSPDMAVYHYNIGLVYVEQARIDKALSAFCTAIELEPDHSNALYMAGLCHQNLGDVEQAVDFYEKALAINPEYAEIWSNLGNIASDLYRFNDAELYYLRAIVLNGRFSEAHNNLGVLYSKLNRQDEACQCFLKAIEIMPDFYEALNNLGNSYKKNGRMDDALACYERSLEINPNSAETLYAFADGLMSVNQEDRAVAYFKEVIKKNPEHGQAVQRLYSIASSHCDWPAKCQYSDRLDQLSTRALDRDETSPESPFACLERHTDIDYTNRVTRSWSRNLEAMASGINLRFVFQTKDPGKITVGYYSNNFRNHANAHLVSGLFERHDRDRFNVVCFSYGEDDGSEYRKRIEKGCDLFVDLSKVGIVAAAESIYNHNVDILIDLTGYTLGNRTEVCAMRPAPVQVRYLGFPSSMCSDFFDYIITDKILTPPETQIHYSEKFIYMPDCYQINEPLEVCAENPFSRSHENLPEDGFVFSSFNASYKIEPIMFSLWMRVLKHVPGSVLWLLKDNDAMVENLSGEAEEHGVDRSRLIFAEKLSKKSHLERLRLADLVLDTRIVGGHLSTSDAVRVGVPVITLQGDRFISRASSTILNHVGLPELITQSLDEYESLAVKLATHRDMWVGLKKKLAGNLLESPLFDTNRFVRHYETGLNRIWDIYLSGKKPEQIEITREGI